MSVEEKTHDRLHPTRFAPRTTISVSMPGGVAAIVTASGPPQIAPMSFGAVLIARDDMSEETVCWHLRKMRELGFNSVKQFQDSDLWSYERLERVAWEEGLCPGGTAKAVGLALPMNSAKNWASTPKPYR